MKARLGRCTVVLLAAWLLCPCRLAAEDNHSEVLRGEFLGCPGSQWPWTGQGPFVNVPAALAAGPSTLVGTGFALALMPADLIASAMGKGQQDEAIPRFAKMGICGGVYFGKGIAYVVGAPFWGLKKAFWDGPKWLFSGRKQPRTPAEPSPRI